MIVIDKAENKALMSDGMVAGQFRIKESAKAFSILSSSLYSNPIRAIVRELGCNARDSHVSACNPEPFEVHLPTRMEPEFYVRDFGTGLSNDDVINIFTTYFESTKTNSNLFIGALGLGSKSPFAYTENFTVTSIKDGIKGIYTAFINDEGVPSIVRMLSIETSENNGVEVKFSVKSTDFYRFAEEAKYIYQFFDRPPSCNVKLQKTKREQKFGVDTLDVRIHPLVVVMGGICYPIDMTRLTDKNINGSYNSNSIVIDADIGEVDIQPSREGLTYTKKTIDFLNKSIESLKLRITAELEKISDSSENDWDKFISLSSAVNSSVDIIKNCASSLSLSSGNLKTKEEFFKETETKLHSITGFSYSNAATAKHNSSLYQITPMSNCVILYNDSRVSQQDIYDHMRKTKTRYYLIEKSKTPLDLKQLSTEFFLGKEISIVSGLGIKKAVSTTVGDRVYYNISDANYRRGYGERYKWERKSGKSTAKYYIKSDARDRDNYSIADLQKVFGSDVIFTTKTSNYDTSGMIEIGKLIIDLSKKYENTVLHSSDKNGSLFGLFVLENKSSLLDKDLVRYIETAPTPEQEANLIVFLQKYNKKFVAKRIHCEKFGKYAGVFSAIHFCNIPVQTKVDLFNSIFSN